MQKEMLKKLIEISEKIHNTENLEDFFSAIAFVADKYILAKDFSVMIEQDKELIIKSCSDKAFQNCSVPINNTVVGDVFKSGKELVLKGDINLPKDKYDMDTFCCIPIKIGDKIYGVICFADKVKDAINDDELEVIRYVANQSALAIERHLLSNQNNINDNVKKIGVLKSSVAHDIANLLNVVGIYIEMLEEEIEKTPKISDYFENIYTELKRVSCLATDMLDYSKQELVINKSKFLVSDILNDLKRHDKFLLIDKKIEVLYILNEDFEIKADKDRLFRVNFNLINNSIDALKDGGIITFKVKKCGKECVFLVSDNGIGIDKENLKKLFNPFFTAGKANGTGLGLAVVDEIIKAHKGKIYVKSQKGKYTCFMIRIPIDGKTIN